MKWGNMSEHKPAAAPGEPEVQPRKRRRIGVIVTLLVVAVAVGGAGAWWFGAELPAQQAVAIQASAQASEQALVDAAAKKKDDDSAAFWAGVDKENKAAAAKESGRLAAAKLAPYDRIKPQMEAQGWTQFSGAFYYQYADPSEFSCGYFQCIVVHVTTMAENGCPGGLYVEATVDMGSATVGRANSITAALTKGKDAIVKLQDNTGQGDKIGVTDIHCLGA
jgi:cytoskeletal protein RodZ